MLIVKVFGKIVCGGHQDKTNLVNKIEVCFRLINSKEKPLAAYLFANDKEEFVRNVSAGGMIINNTFFAYSESASTENFLANGDLLKSYVFARGSSPAKLNEEVEIS